MRLAALALLIAALALAGPGPFGPTTAEAGQSAARSAKKRAHVKPSRRAKVAGYVRRTGGYSYNAFEIYTLPAPTRQGSPFDSGFFFDSGLSVYGNQAPF